MDRETKDMLHAFLHDAARQVLNVLEGREPESRLPEYIAFFERAAVLYRKAAEPKA